MKSFNIKLLLLTLLIGTITSCKKVLDLQPLDSYTDEAIFSDPELTKAYITKHYALLRPGWGSEGGTTSQYSLRFVSDEAMCNFNWQNYWDINRGAMTPDQLGGVLNTWDTYYSNIRDINIVFKNLNSLNTLADNVKNTLIGEAHFFRAFYYMDLVNKYGGVPLITEPIHPDDPNKLLPRNSYDEVANFVVSELEKAANLLPDKQTGGNLGRATKGAALAFKARMLLYMASPLWNTTNDKTKWQKAADAAKAVIDLDLYSLDPDYKGLFLNPQSPEIILERLYNQEFGTYFDWSNTPNAWGGYSATCVLQDMVDEYEMEDGTMPNQNTYTSATSNPWKNRDPRFYASVVYDESTFRGKQVEFWENEGGKSGGTSNRYGKEGWNASKTSYTLRKFMDESLQNAWSDKSKQPWVFCRLAEVYLNYAEAMYQVGDEAKAREYVNKVRARARGSKAGILPDITESGNALLLKIQHERKVELAFEDHRFFDVRRWKIAETTDNKPAKGIEIIKKANGDKSYSIITVQSDRKFDASKHYLFPIPRYEIQRNNKLAQNPGY